MKLKEERVINRLTSLIFGGYFLLLSQLVNAQCSVTVTPTQSVTITCGETVDLLAYGAGTVPVLSTDFNNGTAGTGWTSTGGATFSQPCGSGIDGTPYYWASTSAGTPQLTTNGFDVSCGAQICFDMVYSVQGGSSPCEGPDEQDEGVSFQYSTDGGTTWVDIIYYSPGGFTLPSNPGGSTSIASGPTAYTTWNTYCVTIPPGASTSNTMFQWIQLNSSGTCCDNWGLDNVEIIPGLCGGGWTYDWSNIPGVNNNAQQTVSPMTTTQYTITLSNGSITCYDTVDVIVLPLIADATTSASNLTCPNCADLDVTITNSNAGSIIDDFDPAEDPFMWDDIQGGSVGIGCGGNPGNAMFFDGTGTERSAVTTAVDATTCGVINFCLRMGSSSSGGSCGNPGTGEDIAFEYSTNGGTTWTTMITYAQTLWDSNPNWQCFSLPIPPPAQTTSTKFRWRQTSYTPCTTCDNWSLDNVNIPCAPPAYDFSWSPALFLDSSNIQSPQSCALAPVTYTATVTDPSTGCSASDTLSINVTCDCTIFGTTAVVSQCENGNEFTVSGEFYYIENPGTGTLVVEVINSSGTYTQTFSAPFTDTTLQNYSISGLTADGSPLTVNFYFTDDLNCSAQETDTSPSIPTLTSISGGANYCAGQTIDDILVEVTGNGPWTIDFLLDGVPTSVTDTATTISLGNSEGTYELVAVNDFGCTNTAVGIDSIGVYPNPTLIDLYGGNSYCAGDTIDFIEIDMTGTGPWTVDFTIDGVANSVTGNSVPIQLGNSPGVYIVSMISDAYCSSNVNDSESIIIDPSPTVDAGTNFSSCENDPIVLSASGASTYVWDNGVQNGVSFVPSGTMTYTVIGTNAQGCSDADQITVTIEPLPSIVFLADSTQGCEPMTVTFINQTPGNMVDCQWDFGDGSTGSSCDTITHTYQYGGTYDVTLQTTSALGCVNEMTYPGYIYVENNPLAGFTVSSQQVMSLDPLVSFSNTTTGAVNYIWDFGDDSEFSTAVSPYHSYPQEVGDSYLVTLYAYSPIGCIDSAWMTIEVKNEIIYYIPNTFTPDDDEFNQNFQPVFTAGYDPFDFNMKIFNRWGELIFESNNDKIGWDGTYGGRIVPDGTYTWKIEFKTLASDERVMISGHVNLIH